jgi:hypothetical protein
MNKTILISIVLMTLGLLEATAQNFLGHSKETIRTYMADNYPDYEKSSFKLADKENSDGIIFTTPSKQVRIYVFEDSSTCTAYLVVYRASDYNRIIDNFNKYYVKHGELEWLEDIGHMTLHYKIEREEGLFTVAVTEYLY